MIALATAGWDLYSKHIVFEDLGYPATAVVPDRPGNHEIFEPALEFPNGRIIEGVSQAYLDGWIGFRLHTSFNEGALWGVGQGGSWVFAALSVVAVAGVMFWLFRHGAASSAWLTVALGFVTGGALGNLFDRLGAHGYADLATRQVHYAVRDFLLFTFGGWHWPVFNFADVFLVTGAIMLVVQSLFLPDPQTAAAAQSDAAGEGAASVDPATRTAVGPS